MANLWIFIKCLCKIVLQWPYISFKSLHILYVIVIEEQSIIHIKACFYGIIIIQYKAYKSLFLRNYIYICNFLDSFNNTILSIILIIFIYYWMHLKSEKLIIYKKVLYIVLYVIAKVWDVELSYTNFYPTLILRSITKI
jgi:hypothetical protein